MKLAAVAITYSLDHHFLLYNIISISYNNLVVDYSMFTTGFYTLFLLMQTAMQVIKKVVKIKDSIMTFVT